MKLYILSVTSIVGGLTLTTALGIEPPPENVVPPSAILEMAQKDQVPLPDQQGNLGVPFVGLTTAPLPEIVAAHVNLAPNSALIIRTILPGSPAEQAGLSANDIILKIGDEEVSQPEQLSAAIRSHEIGDKLGLTLIHRGKPAKVVVTLAQRPADLARNGAQEPMLEGLPQAHADQLRGLIQRNLDEFGANPQINGLDKRLRQMRQRMNRAFGNGIPDVFEKGDHFDFKQNATVRLMDGQGTVEIKSSEGSTEVTVRDQSGNVAWQGPWDTDQDKAAAPDEIRERINKLHSGSADGFGFQFGKRHRKAPDVLEN